MLAIIALIAGLGLGYWLGSQQAAQAYNDGYQKAVADARATQEAVARQAAADAARAANPFQAENPLEGVTANPFEEAQKALNPFQ